MGMFDDMESLFGQKEETLLKTDMLIEERAERRVLIIGKPKEFFLDSLENDLTLRGFKVETAPPTVTDVSKTNRNTLLYLLMVEYVQEVNDLIFFLRDLIYERHISLCILCLKQDRDDILRLIPKEDISAFFFRPVNIRSVGAEMSAIFDRMNGAGKKRCILLIDDDPAYLRRTQNILKGWYKTYIAGSGASGIMILSKHAVDLILLDMEMPIIDGIQTYKMIKAEPALQDIPIMFLTGRTDRETVEIAAKLQPEKYLSKEITRDNLLLAVSEFFVNRKELKRPDL